MRQVLILIFSVSIVACSAKRSYWHERLAQHEAWYAKQSDAIPDVVRFYTDSAIAAISMDSNMVKMIERIDSLGLNEVTQKRVDAERWAKDEALHLKERDKFGRTNDQLARDGWVQSETPKWRGWLKGDSVIDDWYEVSLGARRTVTPDTAE